MKITVKRRHVLDALRFNNLVSGSWYKDLAGTLDAFGELIAGLPENIYKPNCTACLVGSTIRRSALGAQLEKLPERAVLEQAIDLQIMASGAYDLNCAPAKPDYAEATEAARKGNYFGALSHLFEGTVRVGARRTGKEKIEYKLTKAENTRISNWVKKNIPVSFEVTVPL